jgi:hypothetical protein
MQTESGLHVAATEASPQLDSFEQLPAEPPLHPVAPAKRRKSNRV